MLASSAAGTALCHCVNSVPQREGEEGGGAQQQLPACFPLSPPSCPLGPPARTLTGFSVAFSLPPSPRFAKADLILLQYLLSPPSSAAKQGYVPAKALQGLNECRGTIVIFDHIN